jgi:glycosyltransferase involved in cell wall biosynthesis
MKRLSSTRDRPLRILMLAPEPFFEPRGTPFSEYHRIKALGELGHHVDLVTYPIGRDVELAHLRIFRSPRPPLIRKVRVGPSLTKVVLDGLMLFTIARRVLSTKYDAIHSHEEMGLVGVWLSRMLGIPHLYDMHSSLPQQLSNFTFSRSAMLRRLFGWAEERMVHGSRVVVTICQELQDTVQHLGVGERALLIENVMGGDVEDAPSLGAADVRRKWQIPPDAPLVLYTGTFEPYQGLHLLTQASALLATSHPQARVLVVGGEPEQVQAAREEAEASGASGVIVFAGQQPARDIPAFVDACDILVSPRMRGTNTPLKIYSYLRSGKPIVATDLLTHTQVLSADVARLVPVDARHFAAAIGELIDSPDERRRLSTAAAALAASKYSRELYVRLTAEAYRRLLEAPSQRHEKSTGYRGSEADEAVAGLPRRSSEGTKAGRSSEGA